MASKQSKDSYHARARALPESATATTSATNEMDEGMGELGFIAGRARAGMRGGASSRGRVGRMQGSCRAPRDTWGGVAALAISAIS